MKDFIIHNVTYISDLVLEARVTYMVRKIAVFLALGFFFIFILLVYLHKNQIIFFTWPAGVPEDYFFSVYIAFSFILFYEVLAMIMVIPRSIADSIGKQYEIMSLVILRSVFEHIGEYREFVEEISHSLDISQLSPEKWHAILELIAGSFGSVFIFFLIGIYYSRQHHDKIVEDPSDFQGFLTVKRIVSLVLIVVLFGIAISHIIDLYNLIYSGKLAEIEISHIFFKDMFSVMIFVDILFVLISTRFSSSYHVVFRNSGLTISTVILRLSFSSSVMVSVIVASFAVLIGIGVSQVYNQFQKHEKFPVTPNKVP